MECCAYIVSNHLSIHLALHAPRYSKPPSLHAPRYSNHLGTEGHGVLRVYGILFCVWHGVPASMFYPFIVMFYPFIIIFCPFIIINSCLLFISMINTSYPTRRAGFDDLRFRAISRRVGGAGALSAAGTAAGTNYIGI